MIGQSMSAFLCVDRLPLSMVPGVNLLVECCLQCAVNHITLGSKLIFLLGTKDQMYALKTWLLGLYLTPSLLLKCASFLPSVECIGFLESRFLWESHMRWVYVRCELLLNFVSSDRFWCRSWMVMLHFYCILIHAVTHSGSAMKSKLSLTLSATLILVQSFSVATILKFHTCNPKNLTHSSP